MPLKSKYKLIYRLNDDIWKKNSKLLSLKKNRWNKLKRKTNSEFLFNPRMAWYKVENKSKFLKTKPYQNFDINNSIWNINEEFYLKKSNLRSFKMKLLNSIKFRWFYGNISKINYKKIIKRIKLLKKPALFNDLLNKVLLEKLDYSIWAINLIDSLFEIKQLISHNYIFINGKLLNITNYNLSYTDIVSLNYSSVVLKNMNTYLLKTHSYFQYRNFMALPTIPKSKDYWRSISIKLFSYINQIDNPKFIWTKHPSIPEFKVKDLLNAKKKV